MNEYAKLPGYDPDYPSAYRPPQIEMIRHMAQESMERNPMHKAGYVNERYDCADDLFVIRKANDWLDDNCKRQRPKMLFDNFWFENELCILFADTNVGKSILAVQLGNAIALGADVNGFAKDVKATPVIYFDFEQSASQFEARYTAEREYYRFSPDFYRAELNAAAGDVRNYLDRVHACIEEGIRKTGAKVLIVDNLTYLANEAERSRDALVMMKFLKKVKSKYGISILALAHTPKRNPAKPLTNNDMQGSKMLVNFCDSAFAMGRSHQDPSLRYLKQIKQRNALQTYGEERVCLFRIARSGAGIHLAHCGFDCEQEHLQKPVFVPVLDKRRIVALHKRGFSNRKIAQELGVAHSTVGRVINSEASADLLLAENPAP